MKKQFPTFIDESVLLFDTVYVSAGVRGAQLALAPANLITVAKAVVADIAG